MKRRRVHVFVGDEVEMSCGIRGFVTAVDRTIVMVEVDHDVMVRVAPWAIAKVVRNATIEPAEVTPAPAGAVEQTTPAVEQ